MSKRTKQAAAMHRREQRYRARRDGIQRPDGIDDNAIMRILSVPPEQAGMRLDRFIQRQLRDTSRTRSQLIITRSAFAPNGRALKKNHRLRAAERVILWRAAVDEQVPDIQLQAVFEDDALLAINKPPFLAVHPSARHHRATITTMLRQQRPDDYLTLTHRLDRETSGVLLLARTRAADRAVKIQFQQRTRVEKHYLTLCRGVPDWHTTRCELPLQPDRNSRYRVKMSVAKEGGRACATSFERLQVRHHPSDPRRRYSLLRCTLHSGRQHQIRVHLSALGLPVLGDKLYGPHHDDMFARGVDGHLTDEDQRALELPRHALHAAELVIDHPNSGQRLRLHAPMFHDMQQFWQRLVASETP
ncbi:MAG TPA: RluA family pseudouridine synthase [Sorangium sp.]|nr:RluA family pseudouridine synthase [Sorangium sp.]